MRRWARSSPRWRRQDVFDEVKRSGLRGRGGAGFLTGLKWEFTARARSDVKYVVCNADEGDPGAFMDRSIIEGDPHSLLEGMAICGYAVGADEGYIYCRAEYPLAIQRLKIAIAQAEEYGLLGDNILGTDFSFHLHVKEGAGAFVCGEETALLASIEGRRGEPRPRPPFPAVDGLWGKPTNLNNVKSYANVPQIIVNGADWFAGIGSPKSARHGHLCPDRQGQQHRPGRGADGHHPGRDHLRHRRRHPRWQAVQGRADRRPAGRLHPGPSTSTSRSTLTRCEEVGAVMGSGGMIVVDEDTCMVEFAKFFLDLCHGRELRQVRALSRRRQADARNPDPHHRGQGHDGRPGHHPRDRRGHGDRLAVRPGAVDPGPDHVGAALLSRRVHQRTSWTSAARPACAKSWSGPAASTPARPRVDVPSYVALVAQGKYAEGARDPPPQEPLCR